MFNLRFIEYVIDFEKKNTSLKERHPIFTKKWRREMIGDGAIHMLLKLARALTVLFYKLRKE